MIGADRPLVLLGAGNMGGALLRGWLKEGIDPAHVLVLDPQPSEAMRDELSARGIRHETSAPDGVKAGILLLAVKPQIMAKAVAAVSSIIGAETVSVSIAAGISIAHLEEMAGGAVIRAMPNTPAMVGRGITGCYGNDKVPAEAREAVTQLLSVSGPVVWVEREELIDAVTAVSGSGPAYAFYLAECMAEAGRQCGLPADLAMTLARHTVSGAGELMHQAEADVATLRKNVTSPNGTTAAALDVLMDEDGLQPLMTRAVRAAFDRAKALGQ
ncbi:pyrroline-5-carboxylate reductase [Pseudohoeflea coraliihabitans]|uniref:Pyrroline-5-carboxylate reductase n=1 Tax=Pseudohoeflea coraliihabitans TaxID=2860393 RepID=A0ABS6WJZ6_9HYPH|nr:pyrroline-5-carboxylate reductase [Pseudohoeflea sp. DP4N28-3]MBW3096095.1 pyrroline-5-carboxylate reductase [Pseudohoeflea sp. DP4N28-3]